MKRNSWRLNPWINYWITQCDEPMWFLHWLTSQNLPRVSAVAAGLRRWVMTSGSARIRCFPSTAGEEDGNPTRFAGIFSSCCWWFFHETLLRFWLSAMFDCRRVLREEDWPKMCMNIDTFCLAVALWLWLLFSLIFIREISVLNPSLPTCPKLVSLRFLRISESAKVCLGHQLHSVVHVSQLCSPCRTCSRLQIFDIPFFVTRVMIVGQAYLRVAVPCIRWIKRSHVTAACVHVLVE